MSNLSQSSCQRQAAFIDFSDVEPTDCHCSPYTPDHIHLACCGVAVNRRHPDDEPDETIVRCTGECGDYLHASAADAIDEGDALCLPCRTAKEMHLREADLLYVNISDAREDLADALKALGKEADSIALLAVLPDVHAIRDLLDSFDRVLASKVARAANLPLLAVAS